MNAPRYVDHVYCYEHKAPVHHDKYDKWVGPFTIFFVDGRMIAVSTLDGAHEYILYSFQYKTVLHEHYFPIPEQFNGNMMSRKSLKAPYKPIWYICLIELIKKVIQERNNFMNQKWKNWKS